MSLIESGHLINKKMADHVQTHWTVGRLNFDGEGQESLMEAGTLPKNQKSFQNYKILRNYKNNKFQKKNQFK